jgi:hypothetical protein
VKEVTVEIGVVTHTKNPGFRIFYFVAAAAEATHFHVSVMNVWPRACGHSWMGGDDMWLCWLGVGGHMTVNSWSCWKSLPV